MKLQQFILIIIISTSCTFTSTTNSSKHGDTSPSTGTVIALPDKIDTSHHTPLVSADTTDQNKQTKEQVKYNAVRLRDSVTMKAPPHH